MMADRLAWRNAFASYEGLTQDEQLLYMRVSSCSDIKARPTRRAGQAALQVCLGYLVIVGGQSQGGGSDQGEQGSRGTASKLA